MNGSHQCLLKLNLAVKCVCFEKSDSRSFYNKPLMDRHKNLHSIYNLIPLCAICLGRTCMPEHIFGGKSTIGAVISLLAFCDDYRVRTQVLRLHNNWFILWATLQVPVPSFLLKFPKWLKVCNSKEHRKRNNPSHLQYLIYYYS